ncbi:Nicotinamidase-related amidase [Microbulbifer donghaiensis]|uniref:Nicotinamidase-related amidase n=1 Tax=Microbulbifer donghaiensis TaxID=494016 RepID=A0A1M4UEI2_9GAMM|nr:isochorismatase family cysteine hydrolase [Microbulbifer donghaiensis]SHE54970.1 Nicotinamidase-related amidase [Microbulbifer donghaiensis]
MKPALLCIDLQHLFASPDGGFFTGGGLGSFDESEQTYYFTTLEQSVLPNIQRLQAVFRDKGIEVIHIRTRSKTRDGRDRTYWHKKRDLHSTPGSQEAEFIDSVAPHGDEVIVNKTGSGPFGNSVLQAHLHQLGISQLYCCGVFTDESVESTIRAAADYGYCPILIADATATASEQLQLECIERLNGRFCEVADTKGLVEDLQQHLRSVS